MRSLGVPEAELPGTVAFLSMAALLFGLPLVPFWGAWAERYSRKAIIVRSAVVEALLFGLIGLASGIGQVAVLVPLVGLNLGNTGVMLAEITDRTPRARLAFAISLVGTASPLGFAIGPALGGFLVDRYGVQPLLVIDAFATLVVIGLLVLFYHEDRTRPRSPLGVRALVRRSLVAVVRSPLARLVFATYFLVLLGQRAVSPFLALWVEGIAGPVMLATTVGLVAGLYGLSAAIGSPLAGIVGGRVGEWRVLLVAIAVCATGALVIAVIPGLLPFAVVYAILGIGFATAGSMLFTTLATGLPTEIRASVLALALVPLYLSGIAGSFAATRLLAISDGDLRIMWVAAGISIALALVPALRLPRGRARPPAGPAGAS